MSSFWSVQPLWSVAAVEDVPLVLDCNAALALGLGDHERAARERAKQGDPIAQLDLDEYRMIQGWIDPETDFEPDEDIARRR